MDDARPDPALPAAVSLRRAQAARALHDLFLANADRGDHGANDELVARLRDRIREHRTSDAGLA